MRQQPHIKAAIAAIPETDWQTLEDYPEGGEAQIAQTMLGRQRLIVRRTRLVGAQAELWPDWRHFAFLTNRTDAIELVEAEHRGHAVVELAIRDLKDQALAHFPSGQVPRQRRLDRDRRARAQPAALDHPDRTARHGHPDRHVTCAAGCCSVPGRITRTARTVTLRMPARWPWETDFLTVLERLRAVPPLT